MTRQEITFTQTISRNQRLQTKTPEKWHVNMASQSECERCFGTYVVIFIYIFRCSGWYHCFNVAAWKICWKKKRFSRGVLANTVRFLRFFPLEILRFFAPDGITELLLLKKVYGEFTLVLNMLMCFSKSRFICFSPKICFHKDTMEQNAQSNVPCKHVNFASRRNPLLGCAGRFYEYCDILLADICLHFS